MNLKATRPAQLEDLPIEDRWIKPPGDDRPAVTGISRLPLQRGGEDATTSFGPGFAVVRGNEQGRLRDGPRPTAQRVLARVLTRFCGSCIRSCPS